MKLFWLSYLNVFTCLSIMADIQRIKSKVESITESIAPYIDLRTNVKSSDRKTKFFQKG